MLLLCVRCRSCGLLLCVPGRPAECVMRAAPRVRAARGCATEILAAVDPVLRAGAQQGILAAIDPVQRAAARQDSW